MIERVNLRFALAVRVLAVLFVGAALVRVASSAISPDGYLTVSTNISEPSPFVSEPKPSERLVIEQGAPYRLVGEPIYFDLEPPSEFESVTVVARYLNRGQSVVELGALANRLDGQFNLQPAENRLIDSLSWQRTTSGRLTLLQRQPTYKSVDDFLANPPEPSQVAVYRSTLNWPYQAPNYQASEEIKTRVVSLRGHHRLLTYTGGEPLSFNFKVQDMNRQKGADPVTVSVYREGEPAVVARTVLEDDGNALDDQKSSGLRAVSLTLDQPQSGLYRVEFTASSDVFIREMATRQAKFVFLSRLYLGDHVGYSPETKPATVFVGGRTIVARTAHEEALQKLRVDTWEIDVREIHARYFSWLAKGGGPFAVESPKRDLLIETDGVIALEADDYFNPLPIQLEWYLTKDDLENSGVDFIVTEYESPATEGDLTVAEATFDVSQLATTEDGSYRFAFSAPGISVTNNDLRLASLDFVFHRTPTGWRAGLKQLLGELGWQVSDRATAVILPDGESFSEQVE
ncbi:MAG: hypothetical protein V1738_05110 [Patescibacteria group bacterium]